MPYKLMRKTVKISLIIVNLFFALSLIISCYGSLINNGDYWFTGLFTLAAFYLFLVNAGFLLFWLFTKLSLSWISMVTLIICWMPLMNVFQPRLKQSFNYRKEINALRVLSWNVELFNVKGHKKHPEIQNEMLQLINQVKPDIICFQEMVAADTLRKGVINYLPDFSRKLNMPYHYYSYDPGLDFDKQHHFGKIIFSKLPIIRFRTITAKKDVYNSTFQYVDLHKGRDTIRVINLHLQSLKFTPDNFAFLSTVSMENKEDYHASKNILKKLKTAFIRRHWQSDQVKRIIDQSPYPVIVCGDLNDVPNSYAYTTIGHGLKNAFREKGFGIGNTFSAISPTLRIDNIFTDKRFDVKQFVRIKKKLSDHYPIIADLVWTEK